MTKQRWYVKLKHNSLMPVLPYRSFHKYLFFSFIWMCLLSYSASAQNLLVHPRGVMGGHWTNPLHSFEPGLTVIKRIFVISKASDRSMPSYFISTRTYDYQYDNLSNLVSFWAYDSSSFPGLYLTAEFYTYDNDRLTSLEVIDQYYKGSLHGAFEEYLKPRLKSIYDFSYDDKGRIANYKLKTFSFGNIEPELFSGKVFYDQSGRVASSTLHKKQKVGSSLANKSRYYYNTSSSPLLTINEYNGEGYSYTDSFRLYYDLEINDYVDSTIFMKKFPSINCDTLAKKGDSIVCLKCKSRFSAENNYHILQYDPKGRLIWEKAMIYFIYSFPYVPEKKWEFFEREINYSVPLRVHEEVYSKSYITEQELPENNSAVLKLIQEHDIRESSLRKEYNDYTYEVF